MASPYIRARASGRTCRISPTSLAVLPMRSSRIAYIIGEGWWLHRFDYSSYKARSSNSRATNSQHQAKLDHDLFWCSQLIDFNNDTLGCMNRIVLKSFYCIIS